MNDKKMYVIFCSGFGKIISHSAFTKYKHILPPIKTYTYDVPDYAY